MVMFATTLLVLSEITERVFLALFETKISPLPESYAKSSVAIPYPTATETVMA